MTLRIVELRKTKADGEIETIRFDRNVTFLVGMRNTSKTTTLRMIDFCLGDGDSAAQALGGPVAEAYAALGLDLEVNGEPVTIRRSLTTSEGRLTKVEVDDLELSTREFQRWIMVKLGWPELTVPKGRAYRSASDVVPLTFRTLLRHIYRKETSWLEFAARDAWHRLVGPKGSMVAADRDRRTSARYAWAGKRQLPTVAGGGSRISSSSR